MTEYSFMRKDIIGTANEPSSYYDLMSVIIIRRGREPDEEGIFDYLAGLFSSDIKRIGEYSHIEWSKPFEKEVENMTGFGDEIYRRGIQNGKIEGQREGRRHVQLHAFALFYRGNIVSAIAIIFRDTVINHFSSPCCAIPGDAVIAIACLLR